MRDLVPATVPIIGYPDEVAMVLRTQQKMGRLLHDDIAAVPLQKISNGRVIARPQLMVAKPTPERPRTRRRDDDPWRAIMTALVFALILLTLGGAVIVAILTIPGLKALVLGAIVVACMVAAALAMRSGTKADCPGVTTHCPPTHHK